MRALSGSGYPPTLSKQTGAADPVPWWPLAVVAGTLTGLAVLRRLRRAPESFRDHVVVITGGSRGLGLALAREFASEGARLFLLARSAPELERVLGDLDARGGRATAIACDIRDPDQVAHAVARIGAAAHRIDLLVNNAGIIQSLPFEHATTADFEDALDTHFWGPLWLIRAVLPWMRQQGSGRIVNISSIGGRIGVPHMAPYCASKFALVGLSDTLRAELAKDGIAVTTVCPNLMRTGSYRNVVVRGQHHREAAWFALVSSLPVLTMSAPRAAKAIVEATRRRRAHATPGWPARTAEIMASLTPELLASITAVAARVLLPAPSSNPRGKDLQRSLRLDLGWLEHWLPRRAAADLNQPAPLGHST
jgi:NAD(P)-dependent dehydrogenase (short-subunit alcohol dehydrogenase family)